MARVNVKRNAPTVTTHEGGPSKHIDTTQQLRRLVLPCLLWEDSFYVDGKTIAEQIADAVKASPASVAAAVAIEAREEFHLRHVPLRVVREMARLHPGTSLVGDTLARVIQRPDEIGEFCAIYWQDAGTSKRNFGKGQPLSAQAKKGLAKALCKFDQYQLAKYAKGGAVRLRDVMFLTQPKPDAGMEERPGSGSLTTKSARPMPSPSSATRRERGRAISPRPQWVSTRPRSGPRSCAAARWATWRCCATSATWWRPASIST